MAIRKDNTKQRKCLNAILFKLSATLSFLRCQDCLASIFNEIINLVKDSSLVYVLGVGDLLLESRTAANRDATLAPMFVAGAIYLSLQIVVFVA